MVTEQMTDDSLTQRAVQPDRRVCHRGGPGESSPGRRHRRSTQTRVAGCRQYNPTTGRHQGVRGRSSPALLWDLWPFWLGRWAFTIGIRKEAQWNGTMR